MFTDRIGKYLIRVGLCIEKYMWTLDNRKVSLSLSSEVLHGWQSGFLLNIVKRF